MRLFWVLEAIGVSFGVAMFSILVTGKFETNSFKDVNSCDDVQVDWERPCFVYSLGFFLHTHATIVTTCSVLISRLLDNPSSFNVFAPHERSGWVHSWSFIVWIAISTGFMTGYYTHTLICYSLPFLFIYVGFYVVFRGLYRGKASHWLHLAYSTVFQHPQLKAWGILGGSLLTASTVTVMLSPRRSFLRFMMRMSLFLATDIWLVHGMMTCSDPDGSSGGALFSSPSPRCDRKPSTSALFLGVWFYGVCAFCVAYFSSAGNFLDITYVITQFIIGLLVHLGDWGGIAFWMAVTHTQVSFIGFAIFWRIVFAQSTIRPY